LICAPGAPPKLPASLQMQKNPYIYGAPGTIRTSDPQIRSLMLRTLVGKQASAEIFALIKLCAIVVSLRRIASTLAICWRQDPSETRLAIEGNGRVGPRSGHSNLLGSAGHRRTDYLAKMLRAGAICYDGSFSIEPLPVALADAVIDARLSLPAR